MKQLFLNTLLWFVFLIAAVCSLSGQSYSSRLYPALINNQQRTVFDIVKTPWEEMWVATDSGMLSFSGRAFETIDGFEEVGAIYSLEELNDSSLCFLTEKGLFLCKRPSSHKSPVFTVIEKGKFSSSDQLFLDNHNNLWISSPERTILFKWRDGFYRSRQWEMGFLLNKGPNDHVWAISSKGEIFRFNPTTNGFDLLALVEGDIDISQVINLAPNRLILGGKDLLEFVWDEGNSKGKITPIDKDSSQILCMVAEGSDAFMISTSRGVFRADYLEEAWTFKPVHNQLDSHKLEPLPFKGVKKFLRTKRKQLWVCTNKGVGLMFQPFFVKPSGMGNNRPWSISANHPNTAIVNAGKTFRIKRLNGIYQIHTLKAEELGGVAAMNDGKAHLWLSDLNSKLLRIDEQGERKLWDFADRGAVLFFLNESSKEDLWACQAPGSSPIQGVIRINKEGETKFYGSESGLYNRILCVREDQNGRILLSGIGPTTYLYEFDPETDSFVNLSLPLPFSGDQSFEIHDFAIDKDDNIWMASTDGFLKYDGKQIVRIKVGSWPVQQEVRSIILDGERGLWLSSNRDGIAYFNRTTFVTFGEEAGLPVEEMVYRGLEIDEEGYLWVGTAEGVIVSRDPYPMPLPTQIPQLVGLSIDGKVTTWDKGKDIRIPFGSKITAQFKTHEFPSNFVHFQGRVNGQNSEWKELDPGEGWTLPRLKAGRHLVQLRSRNSVDSDWSEALTFRVQIRPVWYRSNLAKAIYILLLVGLIFFLNYLRNQRLVARNEQLQELVEERTEKLEDALKAKSLFLANMSHEIRTPMHGVMGTLELLADTELTLEQKDYLNIVRNSSQSLLAIINDILDLSKVESGKLELEKIPFNLRSLVEQVLLTFASKAAEKKLDLSYDIKEGTPLELMGDEVRMGQILSNLVNNAIKFTLEGGVHVRLSSLSKEDPDDQIVRLKVEVIDTGIGIPEDKKAQLFEAFSQADAAITRKYGGTGLGLTIVNYLVELMNGKIYVESKIGEGSNFTYEIQVEESIDKRPLLDTSFLEGKTILLIGKASKNLDWLQKHLKTWKMKVSWVKSLEDAELLLPTLKLDFLIYVGGFEAKEDVKALKVNLEGIPTLLAVPIHQVKEMGQDKPAWVKDMIPLPLRHKVLYNWLTKDQSKKIPVLNSASKEKATAVGASLKILLAEDNLVNKKLALKHFEKIGCQDVDWVGNGALAVEAVENQQYDLVFMDVQMPEMDGLTATKTIRSKPTIQQPIIVALTANAFKSDIIACEKAGMDDFLSKPFKKADLMEIVGKWEKALKGKVI
ncbi:MAG: ATP-binding protein [Bacteroidota bacterium]